MKRKHDVMRSLASQIRSRNTIFVALAAILAVVLITTTAPVEKVSAAEPDPDAEVTVRANAWWALLTEDEKLRAGVGAANVGSITPDKRTALLNGTDPIIKRYVDANIDSDGDIYAVGDHTTDSFGANIAAIRGFQTVDLWWEYMNCQEKNIATGTDNVDTTAGEGYCQDYSALDETSLARVNELGVAILQIDEPGEASADHMQFASDWWSALPTGFFIKSRLLYGAINTDFDPDVGYGSLSNKLRMLVNDRWKYLYDEGGNDVEKWWNGLNCTQRSIVAAIRSDPNPSNLGRVCNNATYDEYVALPNNANAAHATESFEDGSDVIRYGRVILGLRRVPDVAGWWNALSNEERVNVIYGDPPVLYSLDKTTTEEISPEDRAKVQVPYSGLDTALTTWGTAANSSRLSAAIESIMLRQGTGSAYCSENGRRFDIITNPCSADSVGFIHLVEAIAIDIWDPPRQHTTANPNVNGGTQRLDEFDPPYDSVAEWWQSKDCRSRRLAVGEDHNPLDPEVADDPNTPEVDPIPAETSAGGYCRFYPGDPAATDSSQWMPAASTARVNEIALALGVRDELGRPPFNEPATAGNVWIDGPAVVGGTLMVSDFSTISDPDGVPSDPAAYMHQWLRDGEPIPGATGSTYVLTEADIGALISARLSFADGEYFTETVTTKSTSQIAFGGVPDGLIARIEPGIRSVTVSAGDQVVLNVNIYGLQGIHDQSLGNGVIFNWMQDGNAIDGMSSSLTYTAPSSPGAYMIVATVGEEDCVPADRADMETACSAEFEVRVRRPAAPQPADEPPVNPPGEIPTILTDGQGAQYEVFTPVEGGTFDAGEGYSIMAPAGAVPNGEYIGVRMSDDGMASNAGVTSHRYTLGGNMYGIHAVDSTGASVTDYVLEDPARVCVPLPDVLRAQISDLALVTINSDNTLTILAANVRLGTSGTSVCGNLSNLPASVAVGSFGAPDAIPTATPEPTPIPPETGASSPTSNSAVWALLLGIAVLILGSFVILGRRRGNIRA